MGRRLLLSAQVPSARHAQVRFGLRRDVTGSVDLALSVMVKASPSEVIDGGLRGP